ncbi:MAG: hypothetical protein L0H10_26020 [Comamonas sp.]|jgi:hypothetical protein|nr:hypothetical protein [Comamonas sp.]MDN5540565.1 hypothetical protein [Comamonas sp.]
MLQPQAQLSPTEGAFDTIHAQPNSASLINPKHDTQGRIISCRQRHRAPTPSMQYLPFFSHTGKAALPMNRKTALQLLQQLGGKHISIKHQPKALAHGSPWLIDDCRSIHRHIDVDTNTYHDMADICRISSKLEKYPGYFAPIDQHVIRPLELRTLHSTGVQGFRDSKTDSQAQRLNLTHTAIDAQNDTAVQIFGEGTCPDAPTPATTSSLTLGKQDKGRARPCIETTKNLGVSGIHTGLDTNWPTQPSSKRYPLGIKQSHRRRQPVTSAWDLEYLNAQLCLKALQLLPDGTATDPKRRPKGFTGMESTIL